jgi:hypothetical protein
MREPRFSVSFAVHLAWQEKSGATQRITGRCVDLSSEGMQIEIRDRLNPGMTVLVASDEFGRMGHTSVKYCRRDKMQYRAGLRFGTAFQLGDPARQRILDRVLIPGATGLNSDLLP